MATKAENRNACLEVVEALGIDYDIPDVEDMKFAEWVDLLESLEEQLANAEKAPAAFAVAAGKAITTLKGIITAGKERQGR